MKSQNGLYIQMFSLHGLVRASNLEMGRDADTGGQIKYVVELAKYLSMHREVGRVDLFTRLISDRLVSDGLFRSGRRQSMISAESYGFSAAEKNTYARSFSGPTWTSMSIKS